MISFIDLIGFETLSTLFVALIFVFFFFSSSHRKRPISACDNANCIRCLNYNKLNLDQVLCKLEKEKISKTSQRFERALKTMQTTVQSRNKALLPTVFQLNGFQRDFRFETQFSRYFLHRIDVERVSNEILTFCELGFNDVRGWAVNSTEKGQWTVFQLQSQGRVNQRNCELLPLTWHACSQLPTLMRDCCFGNVFVSVLSAGSELEPHCGPTDCRTRAHLPVKVPPANCFISVGGESQAWRTKQWLLFDDAKVHFVENRSSETRIALIVDLWRDELSADAIAMLQRLFPPLCSTA